MSTRKSAAPDHTAERVALWRALHTEIDPKPHVIDDRIGLKLANPSDDWRERPDMHPQRTLRSRASIVARARFIEDLVAVKAEHGLSQYVILGAGLDTFAERRPELASRLTVFEVDRPEVQAWKAERLTELGLQVPQWLKLVPVDFESGASWMNELKAHGFKANQPTVVASTGVAMYLTRDAIQAKLREVAQLSPGSQLAMTFMLPIDSMESEERPGQAMTMKRAEEAGTPFLSFFEPEEILELARLAGFKRVQHVSSHELTQRYFADRSDGLRPSSAEQFLVATT
jgi:methyltransferase (TIGR00027 family)